MTPTLKALMIMTRNGSEVARISRCQRVETKTPRMKTGPPIMIKRKDGVDQVGGKMRMGMKTLLLLRILLEAKRRTETIASADIKFTNEMAAGTEGVVTTIAIRSHAEIAMKTSHPAGIVTVKTIEKLLKMVVTMTRRERGAIVDAIVMVGEDWLVHRSCIPLLMVNLGLVVVVLVVVRVRRTNLTRVSVVIGTLGDNIALLRPCHSEVHRLVLFIL